MTENSQTNNFRLFMSVVSEVRRNVTARRTFFKAGVGGGSADPVTLGYATEN
jgi:hypothetical protein